MIVNREKLIKRLKSIFPFNQAVDERVALLADKSEVVFFKSGDMVYIEGAAAKYLYMIFEGEIEILKEENQTINKKNHLYLGDWFGEDIFLNKRLRQTSARALKDTLLVRISSASISTFLRDNQAVRAGLQPFIASYQLLVKNRQNLDFETESIHFIGQPHRLYLVIKACFFFMVSAAACTGLYYLSSAYMLSAVILRWSIAIIFGIYLGWFFWNFFEWANDLYIFTDRRVINQERGLILFESREETPLDAILSLNSKMNIIGRNFGFGELFIKTFTGSLRLKNVPNINEVRSLLEYLIEQNKNRNHQVEKKDFENVLRDRMGLEKETGIESEPQPSHVPQFSPVSSPKSVNFLNRLFGIKRIEGETVIYRTHWLFLLRKTIFPFLILLSLILAAFYLGANHIDISRNQVLFGLYAAVQISTVLWWLYQYMDWRNDQYMVTPEQIIDLYRKPLGLEDKRTAPLENIQSIRYQRQGLLGLMFNFGTVYVKVGNEDFTFDNVSNPLDIQQTLFGYLERANLVEKKTDLTEQQRQMADWMDAYQRFTDRHPQDEDQ